MCCDIARARIHIWQSGGRVILIVPIAERASAERGGVLWESLVLANASPISICASAVPFVNRDGIHTAVVRSYDYL
jgi:hypothetical protein